MKTDFTSHSLIDAYFLIIVLQNSAPLRTCYAKALNNCAMTLNLAKLFLKDYIQTIGNRKKKLKKKSRLMIIFICSIKKNHYKFTKLIF